MRRHRASGQALVETAVTLPILIGLFFGFLAAGVAAQGYVDLNTAVYLAAASNVTAFAGDPTTANRFATETFDATLSHDALLARDSFNCGGNYAAGGTITCNGSAFLRISRTPLSVVVPVDPRISAQASAVRSPYRSAPP
jgi:Flp pilus assembly protein TadG